MGSSPVGPTIFRFNNMNTQIKQGFSQIGNGFKDLFIGLWVVTWNVTKKVSKWLNKQVHAYPWWFLMSEALIALVLGYVCVGSVRIERDNYRQKAYNYQQKSEQLQIVYDSISKK